jgi:hypothetical protein
MTFARVLPPVLGLPVALAALTACSPGSFSGQVGGHPLQVQDALIVERTVEGNSAVWLVLSDRPDLCAALRQGRYPKETNSLNVYLYRVSGSTLLPLERGTYTALAQRPEEGNWATGFFEAGDGTCGNRLPDTARTLQSGTVRVTDYGPGRDGRMSGTFDLTFASGERAEGAFAADYCDVGTADLGSLACEQ